MKNLLIVFVLISGQVIGQTAIPFVDFNEFFRTFQKGTFRQLEFQRIEEFKAGDEVVAYYDNRGNLRVYDGETARDIANLKAEYQVSDHLVSWKIGEILNLWDAGKMQTLTFQCVDYKVMDSIVVFQDNQYNTINVYWKDKLFPITQATGKLSLPNAIGDNVVAFKDNGDFFKIFWNGQIYEINVWVGSINFSAGADIVAFNDPTTRTFAVFDKGHFIDVEQFFMPSYKAGRGFIVYEDLNGNLIKYKDGVKTTLTNFRASRWEVKDDVIVWFENNTFFMEVDGKKWMVCNFIPTDYLIKNNVLAFRNIAKGVDVSIDGKVTTLTNQMDAGYEIYGSAVLLKLFNRSFKVFWNGRTYEP